MKTVNRRKQFISFLLCFLMLVGMMPSTALAEGEELPHEHTGGVPTCTDPGVCTLCGEAYTAETGHRAGTEATCTAQAICGVCGLPFGEFAGHTGGVPTCTDPGVCALCGEAYIAETGHSVGTEATCTAQAVCGVCGLPFGEPAGHTGGVPTCTEPGVCTLCGEAYTAETGHTVGTEATCTAQAICGVCGESYGDMLTHSYDEGGKCACGAVKPDETPDDTDSAPVCTCDTEDSQYHAPFCPVYVRIYEPCVCRVSCSENGVNPWCESCWFDGVESCTFTGDEVDRTYEGGLTVADINFGDLFFMNLNQQPTLDILITNTGNSDIIITGVELSDNTKFELSPGDTLVPAGESNNSYKLKARANTFALGEHSTTITVTYGEGKSATATASANVVEAATLTVTPPSFSDAPVGYTPAAQAFTINNISSIDAENVSINLIPDSEGNYYFTVNPGNSSISAGATDTSWSAQPIADLPAGVYTNNLFVAHSSGSTPSWIPLSFTVTDSEAGPNLQMVNLYLEMFTEGASPSSAQLKITNTGSEATVTKVEVVGCTREDPFAESPSPVATDPFFTVNASEKVPSGTSSWTVTANSGLSRGYYSGMVQVTYDDGKIASAAVFLNVNEALPTITITTQPQNANVSVGGTAPVLTIAAISDDGAELSYGWYECDQNGNFKKALSTGTSFTVPDSYLASAGTYYFNCLVSHMSKPDAHTISNTVQLIVSEALLRPTVSSPANLSASYGQTLAEVELPVYTDEANGVAGVWTWNNPDTILDTVNPEGISFSARFTPTDTDKYEIINQDVTVKVNKAALNVTGSGKASGTYGAKLGELTVSGLSVNFKGTEVPGTWALSGDEVPDVGDAGKYTATFTPTEGAGNFEPLTAQIGLEISPRTVTVTPDVTGKTYGEDDPALTFTSDETEDFGELILTREAGEDVGEYAFGFDTSKASKNYRFVLAENKDKFVITALEFNDSNLRIKVSDKTYTGGLLYGVDEIEFTGRVALTDAGFTVSGDSATALGTYTATVKGEGNFTGAVSAEWKILPPAIINDVINEKIDPDEASLEQLKQLRLLEEALASVNESTAASETEKQLWSDAAGKLPGLIADIEDRLSETEALLSSVKAVEGISKSNVTSDDRAALEKAKAAIAKLRSDHAANLDDETTEELAKAETRINEALAALNEAEEVIGKVEAWLDKNEGKFSPDNTTLRTEYENILKEIAALDDNTKRIVDEAVGAKLSAVRGKLYGYQIVYGNGAGWLKGAPQGLAFKANGDYALFRDLVIDGYIVPKTAYAAYPGSTIVTLNPAFLNSFYPGWHSIQFIYADGTSDIGYFAIYLPYLTNAPRTGDDMNGGLWLALMLTSMGCASVILPRLRRRKEEN